MPTNKDLSISPYFDDFSDENNYHKILFKPSVSVQVREINQLQTILQNQIEKFGNNVYKRGTIIDGVNFIYYPNYNYIKIRDVQLDGISSIPENYVGHFITDPSSNLTAHIINHSVGYETTAPDLKTLYLKYINSGEDSNTFGFAPGATLKIYDYLDSINKVNIVNGSSGFANTDSVVFCSAIAVDRNSNTQFTVGETIVQAGNTSFAVISEIVNAKDKQVLKIRPRQTDLTNTQVSTAVWKFESGEDIIGVTSGATATIYENIGGGAAATMAASADIGRINRITVVARGEGYYVEPYVTIKSSGVTMVSGSRNYNNLDITSQNYVAQITIVDDDDAVGEGYAFGVTDGVIYQNGYFSKVEAQTVVVSKYTNLPDSLSVGFKTLETIVDSNIDQSLLDNANGSRNQFAPGADRLKLTPTLHVLTSNEAEDDNSFLSLAEFSNGRPYRENKRTQFNALNDEMALRTKEQSGNFVTDVFDSTTTSSLNNDSSKFSIVTDPGSGYIDGYRVETVSNYYLTTDKGTDSVSFNNSSSSLDYGNYILIKNVAGVFNCSTGEVINLINTAHDYVGNTTTINSGAIPLGGTVSGTARVRNIKYDSGNVGTASAVYRLYLFDIKLTSGKTFGSIRGVRTQDNDSIADCVVTLDATTNTNICKLYDTNISSSLILPVGSNDVKSIANISYSYRMCIENASMSNTGNVSYLLSDSNEFMSYSGTTLSDNEKKTVHIAPISNNIILTYTASDGVANVAASNVATMSNTAIINTYDPGDYIALWSNSTSYAMRRITNKTGTTLSFDSAVSFSGNVNFSRAFPKNTIIPLYKLEGADAILTNSNKALSISLGRNIHNNDSITCALGFDVDVRGIAPEAKAASRNNYVKIDVNSNTLAGPWCLGIPDIFRLRSVHLGTSSAVNESSVDVTDQFYIDHNQTADYYGLGYLYKKSNSNVTLTASSWLLVKFDAFVSSPGVYSVSSYVSSNTEQQFAVDSLPLEELSTEINTLEISEVSAGSAYYDLINCIDFRPKASNTAVYSKTIEGANTNPSQVVSFASNNKKFPVPESGVTYDKEEYLGRKDVLFVTKDNEISTIKGVPSKLPYIEPKQPDGTLFIGMINIPAYPCLSESVTDDVYRIINTRISNEGDQHKRVDDKIITTDNMEKTSNIPKQPKAYTMANIGQLERRIEDLEYNVALNAVEADLKDKVIPSAVSPDINRFKFGFYVDNFNDSKNSDVNNLEYSSSVIGGRVVPGYEVTSLNHGDSILIGSYTNEQVIVNQNIATMYVAPPVVVPPPTSNTNPVTPPVTPPPVTPPPSSNTGGGSNNALTSILVSMYRSDRNTSAGATDTTTIKCSQLAGTITFDTNMFTDPNRIIVRKGTTVLYDQSYAKKRTFTVPHNPTTGRDYTITVNKQSAEWEYTVKYPVDTNTISSLSAPSTKINTISYNGFVTKVESQLDNNDLYLLNFGKDSKISRGKNFKIEVIGLKPNTTHNIKVYDLSILVTANNIVNLNDTPNYKLNNLAGLNSTSVLTDKYGKSVFSLDLKSSHLSLSDGYNKLGKTDLYSHSNYPNNMLVGIESSDKTSIAYFNIENKFSMTAGKDIGSVYTGNYGIRGMFLGDMNFLIAFS